MKKDWLHIRGLNPDLCTIRPTCYHTAMVFFHKNYLRIPKCCEVITYVKVKVIWRWNTSIFIVNNYAWQNILSYSPRSNSVEGQMSKRLEGQIVNSNYLCMVICCEGQGYIARSVEGKSWLKDKSINLTYFHFILSLLINILLHKRCELLC